MNTCLHACPCVARNVSRCNVRTQRAVCFRCLFIPGKCGSLHRTLSAGGKFHNADGSARMMKTHLDLAQIQDRQAVALFVRELVGRQRHLVLAPMPPELPRGLNTHRKPEMSLRVDHASRLLCVAYCVFETLTFRPKVELSLVWSPADFHRLIASKDSHEPLRLEYQNAVPRLRRRRARGGTREHHHDSSCCTLQAQENKYPPPSLPLTHPLALSISAHVHPMKAKRCGATVAFVSSESEIIQ